MFDFWHDDPSGYLRHILIGLALVFLLKRLGVKKVCRLLFLLVVAFLKEVFDYIYKQHFDAWDILFTIIPGIV